MDIQVGEEESLSVLDSIIQTERSIRDRQHMAVKFLITQGYAQAVVAAVAIAVLTTLSSLMRTGRDWTERESSEMFSQHSETTIVNDIDLDIAQVSNQRSVKEKQ